MEGEAFSDIKLYEFVINTKNHAEDRRDEINKYYTSLFTAVVSVLPFINNIPSVGMANTLIILSIILSIVGLILSISWVMTLKRIHNYLDGLDKCLMSMEKKHNKSIINHIYNYLDHIGAPDRVTKYTIWVPCTFMIIFILIIIYFIIQVSSLGVSSGN